MDAFYMVLWIVFIYGFIGWCLEVVYAACNTGTFVNRGFVNGPICPIYGFGVMLVLVFLTPIADNFMLLYIASVIFTSTLEFITGLLLEKIFKDKWWDYSAEPFNIHGYICLKFSLLWGIGVLLIVRVVHPSIDAVIEWIPIKIGVIILGVLYATFMTDLVITIGEVSKMPKRLRTMEEIETALESVSVSIGSSLSEAAIVAMRANEELKKKNEGRKDEIIKKKEEFEAELRMKGKEYEEMFSRYIELMQQKSAVHKRLMRAFPHMKKGRYSRAVNSIMKYRKNR